MKTIIIPSNADKTLHFAAEELSRYMNLITSGEYRVIDKASGSGEFAVLEVDPSLAHDGYRIQHSNSKFITSGGSPRGCLYGVYAFLHELGCRWPLPGKEHEVIPRLNEIRWTRGTIESEPAIQRRGMLMASGPEEALIGYVDFLAKNGFNFFYPYLTANLSEQLKDRLADEMSKRDMGLDYGGHWLPGLLPRDLFAEHPEYFRMENGKRTNDLNLCASSTEALDVMASTARYHIDYMKAFSRPESLHLWADDIFEGGWCSCDKCKELTGQDQLLKVLNGLAERLDLDGIKLIHIAYHGSVAPPETIKASDGVRLMYAARERCYRHPLDGCEANRRYLQYLKGDVKAFPSGPEVFDYLQDCILFRFMSVPLHPVIGRDAHIYKEIGVDGVFAHAFLTYSDWAYGPNAYVLGKSLWRGDGSPDDIREYCNAVYGPAGKSMQEYYDLLFDLAATAMETCGYDGCADLRFPPTAPFNKVHAEQLARVLSYDNVSKIEGKLRQALNVGREPYHTHAADQMIMWQYTLNESRAMLHNLEANIAEADYEKRKTSMTADELRSFRDQMISRYEKLCAELDANSALIQASPERLRGPFGAKEGGPMAERGQYGYVAMIKSRLDNWKNQTGVEKQ